ncbi:hypothetical protein AAG906_025552 [Vitis piasezkii]
MIILGDGMGSALDTFCGQSFGAKQYHMLGIHKQRAMVVLLLVSIPVAFIWSNTGYILASLGQDPEISAEAGLYARFMIPSIFAFALLQWLRNKGAALANAISCWMNVLLLAIYVRISPSCKKTWTGFSREAMHDVPKFMRLAIPSAVMICLEIWSFEMMVLLSGLLPNPKLETSALSISLNISSVIYMIPLDFVAVRVSNELGAGRPQSARLAIYVVLFMVTIEGVLVATILISGHKFWGYSYKIMVLVAISHFWDGIQTVLSGMVRGSGKQKIGALINLGAYYLVGIPFGALLAFVYHIGGKNYGFTLFMQRLDRVHHDSIVPVNVA